jgi:hypothetical protein
VLRQQQLLLGTLVQLVLVVKAMREDLENENHRSQAHHRLLPTAR